MIHRLTENDRDIYIEMAREFYHSDAVLHPIPDEYFVRTVEEAIRSDAYAEIFLFECGGETAGYGLTAKTFSQEAGGMCGGSRRSISVKSFVPEVWEGSFFVIWKSRREKKLPVCAWRWRRRIQELCPSMKGLDMRCWITCRWSKMRHNRRNAYMYTI